MSALSELGDSWKQADVIGIDEAQFYKDVSHFSLFTSKFIGCRMD